MESFNVNKVNQLYMNTRVDLAQHLCKQDINLHLPSCYQTQAIFKVVFEQAFSTECSLKLGITLLQQTLVAPQC